MIKTPHDLPFAGLLAGAITALFFVHSAAADASDLQGVIQSCVDCHGPGGVSQHADMPSIAGLSIGVHEDALFAYADEARPCASSKYRGGDTGRPETDMCQIAAALSEDQIAQVAAHFAAQPYAAFKQPFDPAKAQAGKALHDDACERCHSDGGANAEDDAGILAGQPMGYMKHAMAEFRSGEREQPKKMQPKIDALSDADVEALLHFYASKQ